MNDDEPTRAREAQAMKTAIQAMRERWPAHLELIAWQAKVAKARYDALRREGFEVGQALQLCLKACEL